MNSSFVTQNAFAIILIFILTSSPFKVPEKWKLYPTTGVMQCDLAMPRVTRGSGEQSFNVNIRNWDEVPDFIVPYHMFIRYGYECIHMYKHTYIHKYMHSTMLYVCIYIYTSVHTNILVWYAYIHIYKHIYIYVNIFINRALITPWRAGMEITADYKATEEEIDRTGESTVQYRYSSEWIDKYTCMYVCM
jgi:hypothetical protein